MNSRYMPAIIRVAEWNAALREIWILASQSPRREVDNTRKGTTSACTAPRIA